ncbi:MAG: hypothetical protein FJ033_14210 [Chloroflexi bacterium]|nr:hypothetical protein [Chloroflexota bacterium]
MTAVVRGQFGGSPKCHPCQRGIWRLKPEGDEVGNELRDGIGTQAPFSPLVRTPHDQRIEDTEVFAI